MAACPKCGRRKMPKNKKTCKRVCRRCGPLGKVLVYLREIDAGTDNACLVICAKSDFGAIPVIKAIQ